MSGSWVQAIFSWQELFIAQSFQGSFQPLLLLRGYFGVIRENQMEQKMENKMETGGSIWGLHRDNIGVILGQ